jgi:hypothetical protein
MGSEDVTAGRGAELGFCPLRGRGDTAEIPVIRKYAVYPAKTMMSVVERKSFFIIWNDRAPILRRY